ncbi:hypothetical protein [Thermomonospora cellulosilytica]|uniref:Uncharacterized protein n=1 Tax=Thermomonospora cellulosilytica TaxID=1411118 RepID=A0A7W3N2F3_9ACTN|nr:hypothetical protein [Thermomonospora cellulosilytica]MBA9006296.1 hypothetical protein [Thermomonospora cellulosilytica]
MTELSDRYRRLLRWYPRDHRGDHEEEMLDVLLAAARPGRTRPTLQEAVDLVRGGLRNRAVWYWRATLPLPVRHRSTSGSGGLPRA